MSGLLMPGRKGRDGNSTLRVKRIEEFGGSPSATAATNQAAFDRAFDYFRAVTQARNVGGVLEIEGDYSVEALFPPGRLILRGRTGRRNCVIRSAHNLARIGSVCSWVDPVGDPNNPTSVSFGAQGIAFVGGSAGGVVSVRAITRSAYSFSFDSCAIEAGVGDTNAEKGLVLFGDFPNAAIYQAVIWDCVIDGNVGSHVNRYGIEVSGAFKTTIEAGEIKGFERLLYMHGQVGGANVAIPTLDYVDQAGPTARMVLLSGTGVSEVCLLYPLTENVHTGYGVEVDSALRCDLYFSCAPGPRSILNNSGTTRIIGNSKGNPGNNEGADFSELSKLDQQPFPTVHRHVAFTQYVRYWSEALPDLAGAVHVAVQVDSRMPRVELSSTIVGASIASLVTASVEFGNDHRLIEFVNVGSTDIALESEFAGANPGDRIRTIGRGFALKGKLPGEAPASVHLYKSVSSNRWEIAAVANNDYEPLLAQSSTLCLWRAQDIVQAAELAWPDAIRGIVLAAVGAGAAVSRTSLSAARNAYRSAVGAAHFAAPDVATLVAGIEASAGAPLDWSMHLHLNPLSTGVTHIHAQLSSVASQRLFDCVSYGGAFYASSSAGVGASSVGSPALLVDQEHVLSMSVAATGAVMFWVDGAYIGANDALTRALVAFDRFRLACKDDGTVVTTQAFRRVAIVQSVTTDAIAAHLAQQWLGS